MRPIFTFFCTVFFAFALNAANFTSTGSGSFHTPGTWTVIGSDPDGIPDANDNVTVGSGHIITLATSASVLNLNNSGDFQLNGQTLLVFASMVNNGPFSGSGSLQFRSTGTLTGSTLVGIAGSIFFYADYSIAATMNLSVTGSCSISPAAVITNNGTVVVSNTLNFATNTSTFINAANAILWLGGSQAATGTLIATAVPNTVYYYSTTAGNIKSTSYYNLNLVTTPTASAKTLGGPVTVLNNLVIGAFKTLNMANNTLTLGGNWSNNANTNCLNMGTVIFNGSGIQTISRSAAEFFNNVVLSGSGTVTLARNVIVTGNTTLNSGTLNPTTFNYRQKGTTWLGNGGSITTAASGRVIFEGSTPQIMGGSTGTTFGNLEINTIASVTLTSNNIATGTTTLTAGELDPGAFTFHQRGASWMANGATLNTGASGEIMFDGTGAQTIDGTVGAAFGNIEIFSGGVVSLARDLNVANTLLITGGTLDVSASSFNITLLRNFVHNGGSFLARTGTVFTNGSVAQVLSGGATTTFNNITSNNSNGGVSVTSIVIINGILQVNSRNFGTTGIGNIIMTAPGTFTAAKIGPLGTGASLNGTGWRVETFINGPATAYWQYLGTPINGNTLNDWDQDTRFYMSGVGGNDGNACCPVFFSVRTYSTASNTYTNVTSINTALTPCRGYMCWMSDNMSTLTSPLIYDSRGLPNFGTKTLAITAGGAGNGFNIVSNPYACPISYASVVAASGNLNANFTILQENGNYVVNPNGGNIAGGQGFMVQCTSSGTIKFLETCKNVAANPNIIRTGDPDNFLRISSANATNGLGGETVVRIQDEAHNGIDDNLDLPYIASPYDDATNIWTIDKDGQDKLLNALDGNPGRLDIPVTVKSGTPGNQSLAFKGLNHFTAYSCASLEDVATGETINLKEHDTYTYFAESVGQLRQFVLHLERDGNCPLSEQYIAPSLDASTQVFMNNGNILVKFGFEEKTDVVVSVFNVAGQEVVAPTNVNVAAETIALDSPGAHGIYLVRIAHGEEIVTKKIYY